MNSSEEVRDSQVDGGREKVKQIERNVVVVIVLVVVVKVRRRRKKETIRTEECV